MSDFKLHEFSAGKGFVYHEIMEQLSEIEHEIDYLESCVIQNSATIKWGELDFKAIEQEVRESTQSLN